MVTLKCALSLDGKLAPNPGLRATAEPFWLTGAAARADVQALRHNSDAILTGVGTVVADNPSLTDRTGLSRRRPLLRIVLDPALRTPARASIMGPNLLLLHAASADPARAAVLRQAGAELAAVPDERCRLHLPAVLNLLGQRHLRSVLLETGAALSSAFLAADLVHRLVFYYADTELGADALSLMPSPFLLQQRLLRPTRETFPHGSTEDVRISGYLHDPWAGIP